MTEPDHQSAADDARVRQALRFAGLRVDSVYDLVNTGQPYPEAVPTLVKLLSEVQHARIKEGIARALASPVVDVLIQEFGAYHPVSYPEESAKWAIGNAIAMASLDQHIPSVIELMKEKAHG